MLFPDVPFTGCLGWSHVRSHGFGWLHLPSDQSYMGDDGSLMMQAAHHGAQPAHGNPQHSAVARLGHSWRKHTDGQRVGETGSHGF